MMVILIIDDDSRILEYFVRCGKIIDLDFVTAQTGMDGLEKAKKLQPDLIITDVFMATETWNGIETARNLKAEPSTQHIPVIAMTAGGDNIVIPPHLFDATLKKPFQLDDLKNMVARYQ